MDGGDLNGVEVTRPERMRFDAARIDHRVLKEQGAEAVAAVLIELVGRRGELGDVMIVHGPPGQPALYDRLMDRLREVAG
jgi:hypothetical protein